MIAEFDIYGVFVPALLVFAIVAFLLVLVLRRLLDAIGFYRFVWHRPLFDLALGVILFGVVAAVRRADRRLSSPPCSLDDGVMKPVLSFLLRFGVTAVVVAIAGVVAWQLWLYYMVAPWTRDGRVRADVVPVAADVSGLVSDVFVHDNQVVKKGDPLFRIDQKRFEFALAQAKAEAASRQATLDQGKRDLARSKALSSVVVTAQKVEQDQQAVDVQQAALDQATATLNVAKLNLERSTVTAPVNGIVTNFGLLPGRYVTAGAPILAIIDSDTFRVEGYFEETKLRGVHVGDKATVRLLGDPRILSATSTASPAESTIKVAAPAMTCWRRSIRRSAGCGSRNACRFASSSTSYPTTAAW